MAKTNEQICEFENAAKPLVDWLRKNGCPHDMVIVETTHAELFNGEIGIPFYEGRSDKKQPEGR